MECGFFLFFFNGISWYGLSWAKVFSEHLSNVLKPHGIAKSGA